MCVDVMAKVRHRSPFAAQFSTADKKLPAPIDPLRLPSCRRSQDLGESLPYLSSFSNPSPTTHPISPAPSAAPARQHPLARDQAHRRTDRQDRFRARVRARVPEQFLRYRPDHEPDRGTTAQPPDCGERHSRLFARSEAVRTCLSFQSSPSKVQIANRTPPAIKFSSRNQCSDFASAIFTVRSSLCRAEDSESPTEVTIERYRKRSPGTHEGVSARDLPHWRLGDTLFQTQKYQGYT